MKNLRRIRVVASAIIKDKTLLVAQRAENMSYPLCWEVPGGKVEKGESDQEALIRELQEELAIEVEVQDLIGSSSVVTQNRVVDMFVYQCTISKGIPKALEHKQLQWRKAEDLSSLQWAPADIPLLSQLVDCTKGN